MDDDYPFARASDEQRSAEEQVLRARHEAAQQHRRDELARVHAARQLLERGEPERAAQAFWALAQQGVQTPLAIDGLISTMRPRIAVFDAAVRGLLWIGNLDVGRPAMVAAIAMIVIHKLDCVARASDTAEDLLTLVAVLVIPPLYFSWVATSLAYGLFAMRRTGRVAVPIPFQRAGWGVWLALVIAVGAVVQWWRTDDALWLLDGVGAIAVAVAVAGTTCVASRARRYYGGWVVLAVVLATSIAVAHALDPGADLGTSAASIPALGGFLVAMFSPAIASRLGGEPGLGRRAS